MEKFDVKTLPWEAILEEISEERLRQMQKWGEQNPPNGTGSGEEILIPLGNSLTGFQSLGYCAGWIKNQTDENFKDGKGTWRDILLEEVFEAMAEDDLDKLKTELIQTAAVCVAWVEAIERQKNR